jgi:hypothetical protein
MRAPPVAVRSDRAKCRRVRSFIFMAKRRRKASFARCD